VPRDAMSIALAFLRAAGELRCEGLALWVGAQHSDVFQVTEAYIPEQRCIQSDNGVLVHVDGGALHAMNVWLFENHFTIVAQLHSHPTHAYHSKTDDTFPIATKLGSFSIVVPDFARAPFDLGECAVYRLATDGWAELTSIEVADIFDLR
jgi:hypothetical protein